MGIHLTLANKLARKYHVDINDVIDVAHKTMDYMHYVDYAMDRDSDFDPGGSRAYGEFEEWKNSLSPGLKKVSEHIELGVVSIILKKTRELERSIREDR